MKKVTEKKVPARTVKATTRTVVTILCDVPECDKLVDSTGYGFHGTCSLCRRDICYEHTTYDPDEHGDYPDDFCPFCIDIWLPMRQEMNHRHWKEKKKLKAEAKNKSLAS